MNARTATDWVGELAVSAPQEKLRVAVAGLGVIGKAIVQALAQGSIPNVEVSAVSARDRAKAADELARMGVDVPVLPLEELVETLQTM